MALAILGIGLGVVFQGVGQSLRLRGQSADHLRISLAAERLLGELVGREAAPEDVESGEADGCAWRLEVVDRPAAAAGAAPRGAVLAQVRLTVVAPSGTSWEATTLLPVAQDASP